MRRDDAETPVRFPADGLQGRGQQKEQKGREATHGVCEEIVGTCAAEEVPADLCVGELCVLVDRAHRLGAHAGLEEASSVSVLPVVGMPTFRLTLYTHSVSRSFWNTWGMRSISRGRARIRSTHVNSADSLLRCSSAR